MATILIVTDVIEDWDKYFPSQKVISVNSYLNRDFKLSQKNVHVVNLCEDYSYMSSGYYCSLLAEARGHRIIPTVTTINDISQPFIISQKEIKLKSITDDSIKCKVFFGRTKLQSITKLARSLFEKFMIPIMEIELHRHNDIWRIHSIEPFPFQNLIDDDEDFFIESFEMFSNKIWKKPKKERSSRYDIAMLVDKHEDMPPSDKKAIKSFIKSASKLSMNVEIISDCDLTRLAEFDGLFIRATTSISNYTYQFSKIAEDLGLVVIDDPESIMKCTNKVFLTELLSQHQISTPKSIIINSFDGDWIHNITNDLDFPMVVKIPDGSFSRGVKKVNDKNELISEVSDLFNKSALLLVQEFMPTDFDWRIGILNKKILYVCKYFMSRGHWQIYNHTKNRTISGGFETIDIKQAPKSVLDIALKSANLIGNGFYGVDIKEINGIPYIIEINDNPSIDHGVEDGHLGSLLYDKIMAEFLRRIQSRGM